jgi:hypothetical protein
MKAAAAILGSLVLLTASASYAEVAATCFNDSDPAKKALGVWTYEGHADWQSARASMRKDFPGTFVFSFVPGRSEYKVSDLGYCFYMPPKKPGSSLVKCRSGSLHITRVDIPTVVTGTYAFELENGARKASTFSAPYCPKESS